MIPPRVLCVWDTVSPEDTAPCPGDMPVSSRCPPCPRTRANSRFQMNGDIVRASGRRRSDGVKGLSMATQLVQDFKRDFTCRKARAFHIYNSKTSCGTHSRLDRLHYIGRGT